MSQGQSYYSNSSGALSAQRLGDTKLQKVETSLTRPKPRESEPPFLNTQKKPYSELSKFRQHNNLQHYTPTHNSSLGSYKGDAMDTTSKSNHIMVKNYVSPYTSYPQVSVQPRLSKTIPNEEETAKKPGSESQQVGGYSPYSTYSKPDTLLKRTLNNASTPTAQYEPAKKLARFSEPPMLDSLEVTSSSSYNTSKGFNSISESHSDTPAHKNVPDTKLNHTSKLSEYSHHKSSSSTLSNPRVSKNANEFSISGFAKGKELGSGKFGTVYVAIHKQTGFLCAIKEIRKSVILEENIVNQFIRELKIQSCLEHPNVVKLFGFFHDKATIYLIMELGSQGQLYKVIKEKKKLGEATVSFIIRQLCEAVKYLHSLHIIHRDIKPENIVLQYGTVKICDFGWSVCRSGELRSTFCGTPLYVSPEILKGEMYDEKIDIWALGILTYELLVGDTPFEIYSQEELVKIIKEEISFPSDIIISAEAKDFVFKILKKNPDDRLKIAKLIEHPFLQKAVESSEIDI